MKNIRNTAFIVLLFFATVLSFNCIEKPGEFIAPVSEIRLEQLALLNKTKYFAEILKNDKLRENPDQTISYISTQHFNERGLDDQLKLKPQVSTQQVEVGIFHIGSLEKQTKTISPQALGLAPGTYPSLPSSNYSFTILGHDYSATIDYVAINSGELILTIRNDFPFAVTFTSPIVIRNNIPGNTLPIASFSIGRLEANQSVTRTASLNGETIYSFLQYDNIQLTNDPLSTPVTITNNDGIFFELTSTTLFADSAIAVVPEQDITSVKDSVIVVDDSIVVRHATFRRGILNVDIENTLNVTTGVEVDFVDIKENGSNYRYNKALQPLTNDGEIINFEPLRLQPVHLRNFGTEAVFSLYIKTINSENQKRKVTKNDYVKITIYPQPSDPFLYIKEFEGKLTPQYISIHSTVPSNINFEDLNKMTADEINFRGIQLLLKLPISSGFPMDYNLMFYAKNTRKGWIDSIAMVSGMPGFPRLIPQGSGTPAIYVYNVPNFDDFISRFFPEVPDSFYLRGNITLSPIDVYNSNQTYTIYDTTKVYPSMEINFPVVAGIRNGSFYEMVDLKDDEGVSKDFSERVKEATLLFNFINKLPFNMFFKVYLYSTNNQHANLVEIIDSIVVSDTIKAALVDINGYTTTPVKSNSSITLSRSQVDNYNRADSMRIQFAFSTTGNNGSPVKVRTSDYIKMNITGSLIFNSVKP